MAPTQVRPPTTSARSTKKRKGIYSNNEAALIPLSREALTSIALAFSVPLAFYATGSLPHDHGSAWASSGASRDGVRSALPTGYDAPGLTRPGGISLAKDQTVRAHLADGTPGRFSFRHPHNPQGRQKQSADEVKSSFVRRFILNRHKMVQHLMEQKEGPSPSDFRILQESDEATDEAILPVPKAGFEKDGEEDDDEAVDRELDAGDRFDSQDAKSSAKDEQLDSSQSHGPRLVRDGFHISTRERAEELAAEGSTGEADESDGGPTGIRGNPFLSGRTQQGDEGLNPSDPSSAKFAGQDRSGRSPHPFGHLPAARVLYDVIKETKAKSILVCPCDSDVGAWLPPLISKIQTDIPHFRFSCVAASSSALTRARQYISGNYDDESSNKAQIDATYRFSEFWEPNAKLPHGDIVLAFGGIEWVPAGHLVEFLTHLGSTAHAQNVLVGHFPHVPHHDPAHSSWIQSLRAHRLHAHNLHHMMRFPFMFPTPKRSFEGLDEKLPQKELLWYKAENLVNRFS